MAKNAYFDTMHPLNEGRVHFCCRESYRFLVGESCLKCELVYLRSYATRGQVQNSIFRYIEGFYNPIRPHSSIGWMSPMDYEQKLKRQNAA